jgi:hypothetical protein
MYRLVFVYKAHGKWNRQLSRFRYKMVVKDYLRILSMYSHCNNSHSNLFILCSTTLNMPSQPSRAGATAQRIENCERSGELRHNEAMLVVVKAEDSTCVDSVLNKRIFQCQVRRSQVKHEA